MTNVILLSFLLKKGLYFAGKALLTASAISIPLFGLKNTNPLSDTSEKSFASFLFSKNPSCLALCFANSFCYLKKHINNKILVKSDYSN